MNRKTWHETISSKAQLRKL